MTINRKIYYFLKPFLPRRLQIFVRKQISLVKRYQYRDVWPIDKQANQAPDGWSGWPENKKFALILTHDVDTALGQDKCSELMEIEANLGFRSSFNFVPRRYKVSAELRGMLSARGFEVGVHGLTHDGKLYLSKETFSQRAKLINRYLKEWNAVGFRSPAMHHNLKWIHALNIEYDTSTFDTDPFEPQPEGVGTIFPFWVRGENRNKGYIELPYTLPQDFTIFIIMREKTIDIWKKKLDWVVKMGGMALINTHPDYMNFDGSQLGREEYPIRYYVNFLEYIMKKYREQYWHILPKDIVHFWKSNELIKEKLN